MTKENMGDPLYILAEECSEVVQAIIKIHRFGGELYKDEKGRNNRDNLVQEVGDVLVMIDILRKRNVFNDVEIEEAKKRKFAKLKRHFDYDIEKDY